MIKNIYIHIPFCSNICSYCDFPKIFKNDKIINDYLDSLEIEIKNNYQKEEIETIYIGGGTPSSLTIKQLSRLFNILKIINKTKIKEYTFELNIEDINEELLEFLKQNNINRISIGLQTINKDVLETLNRKNNINFQDKINIAKKYFTNINIDLIYGYQNQTLDILDKDLDFIINNDIPHISTYSLIIENNTKLYIDKYKRLDDDTDSKYYYYIIDKLKNNNYMHYEISNFSKDNYKSIHNMCYWNNENYYGFGLGAGSYIKNIRKNNTRSITKYIRQEYDSYKEKINKKEEMEYEMILGLRKIEGVSKIKFYNKYKKNINEVFDIKEMLDNNLLNENKEFIFIPEDKLYIENQILVNFIGGKNE